MHYIIDKKDLFLKNKSIMISNNKTYFSKSLDSFYMFAYYSILFLRISLLLLLGFTTYFIVFISDTFPILNIHVIVDKCYYSFNNHDFSSLFSNNTDAVIDADSETENKKIIDVVKYYNKWSQMEWTDDDIETVCVSKNNFVIEQTSLGNIIMHYNLDDEAFHYYSDVNIPNITLDIVCRKYVVTYHCPWLYVHRVDELEKINQDNENDNDETENIVIKTEEEPKKSNMAKFKTYNKKKMVSIDDNLDVKSNKYIHKGKIMDCKLLATTKLVSHKKISFSDFKKNM